MPALERVPDAASGLALEAALFGSGEPGVLVWSAATPGLVCPAAYRNRPAFDEPARRSADRGWPVNCRQTGGGAVPQGPGVINLAISVAVGHGFTIDDGYRLITRPISSCLADDGLTVTTGATPGSFCDGRWNLSVGGRKVVGTAQSWRPMRDGKIRILAHALILTQGDVVPGAEAVRAFHRDLGLAVDIHPDVHATLETAFGVKHLEINHLAMELHAAAHREVADAGSFQGKGAAA